MVTSYNTAPSGATKSGSNTILVILGLAAAIATGYYFLVHKPEEERKQKQQGK